MNYNRKVFEEVSTALEIWTFQDKKQIDSLETFSLQYYWWHEEMRIYLVKCDWWFILFMNEHHVQYCENALYLVSEKYIQVSVDSHIRIDVIYFCKVNFNYVRSYIIINSLNNIYTFFLNTNLKKIKSKDLNSQMMNNNNLMICSQTVYDWSFDNKQWCKFSFLSYFSKAMIILMLL